MEIGSVSSTRRFFSYFPYFALDSPPHPIDRRPIRVSMALRRDESGERKNKSDNLDSHQEQSNLNAK